MKASLSLSALVVVLTVLSCDVKKPDFTGTWQVRRPAGDSSVTFVVSVDPKGNYSVSGQSRLLGGLYLVQLDITDVRLDDDALKFKVGPDIPMNYEVRVVSKDTISGRMEFPTAKTDNTVEVLWVRANRE